MPKVSQRVPVQPELQNPTGTAIGYSAPGATGPGFYQGIVGRKTGRAAPRPLGRTGAAPRHEAILEAHGLMSPGQASPGQGQLFSPDDLGPAKSSRELAREHDVAPPLASQRPGFMPELYEAKNAKTGVVTQRSTPEAHKTMVRAIERLPEHELVQPGDRVRTSERLPEGVEGPQLRGPVGEAMHQRQATYEQGHEAPWYAKRTETATGRFDVGVGEAAEMVANAAERQGTSYRQMARTTAITSPRTRWTEGHPGTDDYAAPNLESAENVTRDVKAAQAHAAKTDRPFSASMVGGAAYGRSLGEAKAKAGEDIVRNQPGSPIPIVDIASQKVPNFNASFMLSHPSRAIQAQAATAYTVDTHDVTSQGSHVDLLKTQGGHAIARMLGRRTALKNRELGPMGQSRVWEGQRSKTAEPFGDNALFETTRAGHIRPRADALPDYQPPVSQQFDNRSPTARKHGLEF